MTIIEKFKLIHQILKVKFFKKDFLESFRWMYSNIPAYKKFIDERGLHPERITHREDIPIMTKGNYIEKYPLAERMKSDARPLFYAQSSGTTGTPMVWPIGEQNLLAVRYMFLCFEKFYNIHRCTVCITIELAEWAGGLAMLTGPVLFRYNDSNKQAIIKTDRELSNLAEVLRREKPDALIMVTYPEVVASQVAKLKQMPIENIKIIGIFFLGGTLTLEQQKNLQAMFPAKKLRFNVGYLSSDAGHVGMTGVLSAKEGLKLFPPKINEQIAERYDPLNATVFVPALEVHIEIIDNIFHLTNLYNPVPILRYCTDDVGGKVDDIEFHKPLYWIVGRRGEQLIIRGATMNLKRAKTHIVTTLNLDNENQIVIRKNKDESELPTWSISFQYEGEVDVASLEKTVTDIIIDDSYEIKRRLETDRYSRETFKPEINIL